MKTEIARTWAPRSFLVTAYIAMVVAATSCANHSDLVALEQRPEARLYYPGSAIAFGHDELTSGFRPVPQREVVLITDADGPTILAWYEEQMKALGNTKDNNSGGLEPDTRIWDAAGYQFSVSIGIDGYERHNGELPFRSDRTFYKLGFFKGGS